MLINKDGVPIKTSLDTTVTALVSEMKTRINWIGFAGVLAQFYPYINTYSNKRIIKTALLASMG